MFDQKLYDKLVSKTRINAENGCWEWTGYVYMKRPHPGNRYGGTSIWDPVKKRGRSIHSHRAMMFALIGPLPREQCVCHKCDNPLCINPEHLFVGTMKDNIWDSRRKGRHHESRRDHCERGHPLFGENLYFYKNGGTRHCKICCRARMRIKMGWPADKAYEVPAVPMGYALDFQTGKFVPSKTRRRADSAGASRAGD